MKHKIFKKSVIVAVLMLAASVSYRFSSGIPKVAISQDKGMSVEEFQKRIANTQKPLLVYFNASWCKPCVKLKPEMDELEREAKAYCDVLQINTDDNPKIAEHFEVNSLPMFVIYKNGRKVWENIGTLSKSQLQSKMESYKN